MKYNKIFLGGRDGAFPRLLTLARLGLGGTQGNGNQYTSWIHKQDAAKCTEWLLELSNVPDYLQEANLHAFAHPLPRRIKPCTSEHDIGPNPNFLTVSQHM